MQKFIIIATQRSGSNFLTSCINNHPDIFCDDEIFLHLLSKKIERMASENKSLYVPYSRDIKTEDFTNRNNITSFLDYYYNNINEKNPYKKYSGFNLKYRQIKYYNLFEILQNIDFKVIHLIRKNILKTFISKKLHDMRFEIGRNSPNMTYKPEPFKIELDENFLDELTTNDNIIQFYKNILKQNFSYLKLYYEDFFDKGSESESLNKKTLDKIYDFFSVQNRIYDLKTDYKKLNPDKLNDLIINYDFAVQRLKNSRFEYLLDEE